MKSLRYLWTNIKHINICVMRVPEELEKGAEKNSWRNNSLKFPSLTENINLWIQEEQIIQNILIKIFTPIHIIVKWNTKKKISEAARENGHTICRWQYEFKLISHQNYGGWEEGIVREFGMNMYTLLHFK